MDLEKLIQNILAASKRGESSLGEFKISRRHRGDGREIFLLTRNASIIAQVCLPDRTMQQIQDETKLKVNLSSLKPRRLRKISSINASQEVRIGDLKPGMNRINLKAKVLEVSSPRHVFSKLGVPLIVSTAVISDGTGKIKMSLWNDQVNAIGIGDVIQIENGQVKKYNGEPQIAVTRRYGKLGVISKAVNGRQTLTSKPTIMASQS